MTNAQVIARVRPAGAGRVISVSWDKTAAVWSTETATKLGTFGGHQMAVLDACGTPDGGLVRVPPALNCDCCPSYSLSRAQ